MEIKLDGREVLKALAKYLEVDERNLEAALIKLSEGK